MQAHEPCAGRMPMWRAGRREAQTSPLRGLVWGGRPLDGARLSARGGTIRCDEVRSAAFATCPIQPYMTVWGQVSTVDGVESTSRTGPVKYRGRPATGAASCRSRPRRPTRRARKGGANDLTTRRALRLGGSILGEPDRVRGCRSPTSEPGDTHALCRSARLHCAT